MMRRQAIALLWYARYADAHRLEHKYALDAMMHGDLIGAIRAQRYAAEAFESMKFWREAYSHE